MSYNRSTMISLLLLGVSSLFLKHASAGPSASSFFSARECEDQLLRFPGPFRRLDTIEFPKGEELSFAWIGILSGSSGPLFLFTAPVLESWASSGSTLPEVMRHQEAVRILMQTGILGEQHTEMGGTITRFQNRDGRIVLRILNYSGVSSDQQSRRDDEGLWLSSLAYWIKQFGSHLGPWDELQTNFGGRVGLYFHEHAVENDSTDVLSQAIADPLRRSARTLPPLKM